MAEQHSPPFVRVDDLIEKAILDSRRVFLSDAVTSESAEQVIRKLWYLERVGPKQPIVFVINSPGGVIDAGFAIWDQIKMLSCPVTTLVTGLAASMGSVLSLCAGKGRRFATPNARIMIHQPAISGPVMGPASDLDIQAREILRTRDKLIDLYCEATGRQREEIATALDRDRWMNAQEAVAFGLIDKIVTSYEELAPSK